MQTKLVRSYINGAIQRGMLSVVDLIKKRLEYPFPCKIGIKDHIETEKDENASQLLNKYK